MRSSKDEDPYSRVDYRRMIAWPARIARERPFLERELRQAPHPSVLDLGCGTGEHAHFLASLGFTTVGVDRSEAQIAKAREWQDAHPPFGPRFLLGDMVEVAELTDERFGAALCLGNGLPHLEDDALDRVADALRRRLLPNGRLLIQLLNYHRVLERRVRHLPLNFRQDPEGEGEVVFLRLITPDGDDHVLFYPLSLALHPGADPPVELARAREVRLRAWKRAELEQRLAAHGFRVAAVFGDMTGGAYRPAESGDLVVVAVAPAE